MTTEEQDFLLRLARQSIDYYQKNNHNPKLDSDDLPSRKLFNMQGSFVTIKINGKLRGCIGRIEGIKPIYEDVIENSISAAFYDPRFEPLKKEEIKKIKIEISLLSKPKMLSYKTPESLLKILGKEKPGVIIKKEGRSATFLPQVWEELSNPKDFLTQLCIKAGLSSSIWEREELEMYTYTAEVFRE